jgi:hypothetical protein
MKSDTVQCRNSLRGENNFNGLDGAIEVLIVDGIFVVPDSGGGVSNLVTNEYNPVIVGIGLHLVYRGTGPGPDGGLHSHRRCLRTKVERGIDPAHAIPTVRGIVILVAFSGMCLAPSVFMRSDVLGLGKISRAGIERCVQIIDLNKNPVRYVIVHVAGVIVRVWIGSWEKPCERIDPGA